MTPVSHGKPCAGNPHARFEEGASAPEKPRRNALLHKEKVEDKIDERAVYDRLWKCRDFEIDHVWQRAVFLSAFLLAS